MNEIWQPKLKLTELGARLHAQHISIFPKRAYDTANAFDLFPAIETDVSIQPGKEITFETGVRIWLGGSNEELSDEFAFVGIIAPRSSAPKGFLLQNTIGIIDQDYQGPLKVKVMNTSEKIITISPNVAFAQLLITVSYVGGYQWDFDEVEWPETKRNENGFGSSTGK
jgi:deoxyuridine 5'-triphosphate nucleotidohydrolase